MGVLRIVGTAAAIIGAAVSLILLLIAGKSVPLLLLVLFVGWALLPFVVLAAGILWKRFSVRLNSAFAITSIVVGSASIAVYSYFTISPLTTTPARTWLLTPGLSLILIAAAPLVARLRKKA